jgi:hypothetical protein
MTQSLKKTQFLLATICYEQYISNIASNEPVSVSFDTLFLRTFSASITDVAFCSARKFNKPFAIADSPRPSSLHPRDRREARDFISLPIRYLSHSRIHLRTFSIYRATSSPLKAASSLADLPLTLLPPPPLPSHSLAFSRRSRPRKVFLLARSLYSRDSVKIFLEISSPI